MIGSSAMVVINNSRAGALDATGWVAIAMAAAGFILVAGFLINLIRDEVRDRRRRRAEETHRARHGGQWPKQPLPQQPPRTTWNHYCKRISKPLHINAHEACGWCGATLTRSGQ